jgi:twitching motility protein PilI
LSLAELIDEPFTLLLEIERRARAAIAKSHGSDTAVEEWVGVAFKLGGEPFVTARADVREVLPAPEQITRIPGARPWLRGIANVRGQLLTIVDLKAFLGGGTTPADRRARLLVLASREVPTAVIVDEVLGFRRFAATAFAAEAPATSIRCEHYLAGAWSRDDGDYPLFDMGRLLEDANFLNAGALKAG